MIISPANILHLIASQCPELTIYDKVMETPVRIEMPLVSGKSRTMVVRFKNDLFATEGDDPALFIKQPVDIYSDRQTFSIIREAYFYESCADNKPPYLHDFLPNKTLFTFNSAYSILVRQWYMGVQPFADVKEKKAVDYLDNIGWVLGHFHRKLNAEHLQAKARRLYRKLASLAGGRPSLFLNLGSTDNRFLELNTPQICTFIDNYVSPKTLSLLREINTHWQTSTLIHSDLNGHNILVREQVTEGHERVYIIDWEYIVWGDVAWDIASVIFHLILDGSPEEIPAEARSQFAAFWKRYLKGKHMISQKVDSLFIQKVMTYVGVKFYDKALTGTDKTLQRLEVIDDADTLLKILQKAEQFISGAHTQIFFPS